jgi:hypothetical protein
VGVAPGLAAEQLAAGGGGAARHVLAAALPVLALVIAQRQP